MTNDENIEARLIRRKNIELWLELCAGYFINR